MTDIEIVLTDLGELATRELVNVHKPYGLEQNKLIAEVGGNVSKVARSDLERKLGKTVVSDKNSLSYRYSKVNMIEDND